MTNPPHKFNKDTFTRLVYQNNVNIELIEPFQYTTVDAKYKIRCQHTESEVMGWQLTKGRKHCCKTGYWESKVKSVEQATAEFIEKSKRLWPEGSIDYSQCVSRADAATHGHKVNLRCVAHDTWFSQHVGSHLNKRFGCPVCKRLVQSAHTKEMHNKGILGGKSIKSVSKPETAWLDALNVPARQFRLKDVENYNVDGYDPATNTVYLFHGRFWHGCPETYDPEETHPITGLKMKELYESTKAWERKITNAGYNLIVKWG